MQTSSDAASQRGSLMGGSLFVRPLLRTQKGFQRQAGLGQDIESLGAVISQFFDNGLGKVAHVGPIGRLFPSPPHVEVRADVGEAQYRNALGPLRHEMKSRRASAAVP